MTERNWDASGITEDLSHGTQLRLGSNVPKALRDELIEFPGQHNEDTWYWETGGDHEHDAEMIEELCELLNRYQYYLLNRMTVDVGDVNFGVEYIFCSRDDPIDGVYLIDIAGHLDRLITICTFDT